MNNNNIKIYKKNIQSVISKNVTINYKNKKIKI